MRVNFKRAIVACAASACISQSAWAGVDTMVTGLTPTGAQVSNIGGAVSLYISTTDSPKTNPAGCPAPDGYVLADPKIVDESLSMALTAIAATHTITLYISGSLCSNNRPMILDFQINW
jgi:hypothetical protein